MFEYGLRQSVVGRGTKSFARRRDGFWAQKRVDGVFTLLAGVSGRLFVQVRWTSLV